MKPSIVISFVACVLVVVGLGNILNVPASVPDCSSGTCAVPQQTAKLPAACDGDCANCPNTACPDNPNYAESGDDCGACGKAPLRKAGKVAVRAPLKAVKGVGKVAKVPVRAVGRVGRVAVKPVRFIGRIFGRRR